MPYHHTFNQAVWKCAEKEEVEEESPASEGEVDVSPPDRLCPPHTTGTTYSEAAANNYCCELICQYFEWTEEK